MCGIVILQPAGAMGLWRAQKSEHGSSIDVRGTEKVRERGSLGLVLTQKMLLLNQTLRHWDETSKVVDLGRFTQ